MFSVSSISMESVSFQPNMKFRKDVLEVFSSIDVNTESEKFSKTLGEVITKHTNMKVVVVLTDDYDLAISVPNIDLNDILKKMTRVMETNNAARYALARNQNNPIGWVDYKTGKVQGIFTDIEQRIYLGKPFWNIFNPDQLTDGTLHEVGHAISSFSQTGAEVINQLGLMTLVKDLLLIEGEDVADRRIALAKEFTKESGIKINRMNQLVVANTAVDVLVELNNSYRTEYRTATGDDLTDIKLWETMADQYAVRMGAGKHLGEVVHILAKYCPHQPNLHRSTAAIALTYFGILFSGAMASIVPFSLAMVGISYAFSNHNSIGKKDIYHGAAERIRKIRQEMILQLRLKKSLDKDSLIQQIDDLEKLIKDTYDEVQVSKDSLFWFMMSKDRQRYVASLDLDKISRNELFVKGHQLTT